MYLSRISRNRFFEKLAAFAAILLLAVHPAFSEEPPLEQVVVNPGMISDPQVATGFLDEQEIGDNPMMLAPKTVWETPGDAPQSFVIDLGEESHIGKLLIWDLNGHADVVIFSGNEGNWSELVKEDGVGYRKWKIHDGLDVRTRYLKVERQTDGGDFSELLIYRYTPEGSRIVLAERERQIRLAAMIDGAKAELVNRPSVEFGTLFGKLPLVDEIIPARETDRGFTELPAGVSDVQTILGVPCRVLPNVGEDVKYFAYRLGEGKYLEPGKAYLMTVEFPDNAPRSFHIANRGADMTRGVQTGQALGDTVFTYTSTNMESLDIPVSNEFKSFQQLFWLNHRFNKIKQDRGGNDPREFSPVRGFDVIVGQPEARQAPLSEGAAVARIRLFEVPDPAKYNVSLNFPQDLPRRHLFYREEMADGVINSVDQAFRSVDNPTDWYVYHMRLMNFLGMNTFSKDLLEFGRAQHWNVENPSWFVPHKFPHVWGEIVEAATAHGLDLLPYYEYSGGTGKQGLGSRGRELTSPLTGDDYTHIRWSEKFRADITDPKVWEEFKHILDLTIVNFKDKGEFVGAWIRPRISQLPMSFADPTLERFAQETGREPITRKDLEENEAELNDYYDWWFGKRKEFLTKIQDYLAANGVGEGGDPVVLFMAVPKEPVPDIFVRGNNRIVVTDEPELWKEISTRREDYGNFYVIDVDDVPEENMYLDAILSPLPTWGNWEWNHASPQADPQNYQDTEGVLMTYPFNRRFTLDDSEAMETFRSPSGLAMIRHFPLNENTMDDVTGYFVSDFERVGPYQMMPEALAVANGDPWYIGYTSGHIFNRSFPEFARRFNANFLALPAMPSVVMDNATDEANVVVRKIETSGKGTYFAIVNTGYETLEDVEVRFNDSGALYAAATGNLINHRGSSITVDLEPFELKSVYLE